MTTQTNQKPLMLKITVKGILDSKGATQLKLANQYQRFSKEITLQQNEYLRLPIRFQNKVKMEIGTQRVLDLSQVSMTVYALNLDSNSLSPVGKRTLVTDPTYWRSQQDFISYCNDLNELLEFNINLANNTAINIESLLDFNNQESKKIVPHILFVSGSDTALRGKFSDLGLTIAEGEFSDSNTKECKGAIDSEIYALINSSSDDEFDQLFTLCADSSKININPVKYGGDSIMAMQGLEPGLRKKYWDAVKPCFKKQISKNREYFDGHEMPSTTNEVFKNIVDRVKKIIAISEKYGSQPKLRPILLVGTPGCGKTRFAKKLAQSIYSRYIYIPSNARSSGFLLSGLDITWKNAQPGVVAQTIIATPGSIVPVVLDEIDKASDGIIAPLYQLLEKESASTFIDEFLRFPINASNLFFIATANSTNGMDPAILDRFTIYNCTMKELEINDYLEIFNEIKASYGLPVDFELEKSAMLNVLTKTNSYRQLHEAIEKHILDLI